MSILKEQFESLCEEYLQTFCTKHKLQYEPNSWVGDYVGTTSLIGDYVVGFGDVRYDIDNDIKVGTWEEWYYYSMKWGELDYYYNINYSSWCKGAPRRTEEEYQIVLEKTRSVELAEKYLFDTLKELNK